MESLKDKIIAERLPQHIAIIMDGNGRWANNRVNCASLDISMALTLCILSPKLAPSWA